MVSRIGPYLLIASLLACSCSFRPPGAELSSRPFEINFEPLFPHLGDQLNLSYRYLGPPERQYRILFGREKDALETMIELAVPTTDPGTFSIILAPRMVDHRDATRFIEVTPGQNYALAFVGYWKGEVFGATIPQFTVQAPVDQGTAK